MFPFYPFPPIRGGMAVQQVTTNGIAFRIALQYLRITKGAWHFGSILRRWHIWKLALQPYKDLDRGWSDQNPLRTIPHRAMAAMPMAKATLIFWGAVRLCHWEIHIGRGSCFITNPPWLTWSTPFSSKLWPFRCWVSQFWAVFCSHDLTTTHFEWLVFVSWRQSTERFLDISPAFVPPSESAVGTWSQENMQHFTRKLRERDGRGGGSRNSVPMFWSLGFHLS